jgi:hypothetical protein
MLQSIHHTFHNCIEDLPFMGTERADTFEHVVENRACSPFMAKVRMTVVHLDAERE